MRWRIGAPSNARSGPEVTLPQERHAFLPLSSRATADAGSTRIIGAASDPRQIGPSYAATRAHRREHLRESVAATQGGEPAGWKDLLDRYEDPGMDPATWEALQAYVARRKEYIERAAR